MQQYNVSGTVRLLNIVAYVCPLCSCYFFFIKHVDMKNRLVDMQENHVNMQRNYVGVQCHVKEL